MPTTREILPAGGPVFLDAFRRVHHGWRARIEVFGRELGAQEETDHLPLMGIADDPRHRKITIMLGGSPDDHVSHAIERPSKILLEQTDEGADQALEIDSADGTKTLLRFITPALPESVDGIVSELEHEL